MDRPPGGALPDHDRFALIGDPDGDGIDAGLGNRFPGGRHRAIENFVGVVLNPPRRRIVLCNLAVGASEDSPVLTDHETGRAGGALIDGEYARHRQLIRR